MGKQQSKIGFLKNWFQDPQNNNIFNDIRTGQQARKYLVLISDLRQLKNYSLRIKQKDKFRVKILFYHAAQNHPFDTRGTYFNVYSENIHTIQEILLFKNRQDHNKYDQQKKNYSKEQQKNRIKLQLARRQQWISKFSDIEIILNIFATFRDLTKVYGPFRINSNMIGVNIKGQVKLWTNQNFTLNYPSSITNNQKIMIDDLIQTLKRVDLKRKTIPFISFGSQSAWEKIEDVIQFLQARANAQNKNRSKQSLLSKYKNSSQPNVQMVNFHQNYQSQIYSIQPNKKREFRPSMPSQQKRISSKFIYQDPNMRACVSNDKKYFQQNSKKQISISNLYQSIPQNSTLNYITPQLTSQQTVSYLSPRYKYSSYKNGVSKNINSEYRFHSPQSQNINQNDKNLDQTEYNKNRYTFNQISYDDQRRGKTFASIQQLLSNPKIQIKVKNKEKDQKPNNFKKSDRKGDYVINSMPNSCVVNDNNNNDNNQKNKKNYNQYASGSSKYESDYGAGNYYNTTRQNKSPNCIEKVKQYQKLSIQNKGLQSIQTLTPNITQSRKLNFIHSDKKGSQQNSKKSSNVYQKQFQQKNFLQKNVQDSLIFMEDWSSRGKTQNFGSNNQKKKSDLDPPKVMPGFLSKRKISNQIDSKKQQQYNQQMLDRRFTGVHIFEKSSLKRQSVEHQSKNKTLGSKEKVAIQIPYYQKNINNNIMVNNFNDGGIRNPNKDYILNQKFKYSQQKGIPVAVQMNNTLNYQQGITYSKQKKNQYKINPKSYINQGKYPIHITQNIYQIQKKELAKKKNSMKEQPAFNVNQPLQFSENVTFHQNQQINQRKDSQQIIKQMDQKQKKKKLKQEMMKMLSSQFGAIIGIQKNQQSHKNPLDISNNKSPQRFTKTQQAYSTNNYISNKKQLKINHKSSFEESTQIQKTKDQLIRQKVQQKKANFAQLKKQALQILSDT